MKRPFQVVATVSKTTKFVVDANTPEEAESIVEGWIRDGETGPEEFEDILESEAVPVDELDGDVVEES